MSAPVTSQTFVLSGASGLLGGALKRALSADGHRVIQLVRRDPGPDQARWAPDRGEIDKQALESTDTWIHLSGENVAEGRWSDERKRVLIESRTKSTSLLTRTMRELERPPSRFLCASAIGIYGTERHEPADESAPRGGGFLAELCAEWEASAKDADAAGVSTAILRIGVVLTPAGGALAKLLPIFKLGGGGPVGGGKQMLSWISLDDTVRAILFAARTPSLTGPVNLVAPHPVSNAELARTLGKVLHRPAFVPVPAFAISAMFGEMGRETVLASQNVVPKKLCDAGFTFEHPELEGALRALIR